MARRSLRETYEDGGPILGGDGEPRESTISSDSLYSSSASDCGRSGNLAIRALIADRYNEDMVPGQYSSKVSRQRRVSHVI